MANDIYIFIGPPGSGKGTLSSFCVKNFGWNQLSTGNLCRKHIAEQTEIGKQIDLALKFGKLISDDLITSMVGDWLFEIIETNKAVILDGYPRTLAQAKSFNALLTTKLKNSKVKVIKFSIADNYVIDRICRRFICQNKECQAVYSAVENSLLAPKKSMTCDNCTSVLVRRNDDLPEAIKERLHVYYKHENELVNFYENLGYSIIEFNAEKSIESVFEDFKVMAGVSHP
jgi:adenylate kinase